MLTSSYWKNLTSLIENCLNQLIPSSSQAYSKLYDAARYSLIGSGKRIRPVLALAMTDCIGGSLEKALTPACCIELVHTYSLIHDDLPCMDNDDFRRGKPSLHKAFPEGHAVLTGDFLLTESFFQISTSPQLTAQQKVLLIKTLSEKSSAKGMIGGQIMDIEADGREISLQNLQEIHKYKTGALITTSVLFGGIIGKATKKQLFHIEQFGENIGLVFQITDDILDAPTDLKLKTPKSTYATILGIESSKKMANQHFEKALFHLDKINGKKEYLTELAHAIINRNE